MIWTIVIVACLSGARVQHPVYAAQYAAESVATLQGDVAAAMAMEPRDLYALTPSASGIYYCGCPRCDGGSQEHAMVWELGMGDRVRCRYCGMEFPNEEYPNNREKVIVAPSGAMQVYRWHEAANGRQYFYEARAWYERWGWTQRMALLLANLYALTGDEAYGDRAAAIVGRFAEVYPDYAIRFDYPFRPVRFWPADQKWPYDGMSPFRGAKFYWWGYGDIPVTLARAYDLLCGTYDFGRVSELLGNDIRTKIEHDLIRLGYEFASAHPDDYTNMSPGLYADMIVAGRIIGAPDMVHEAMRRFHALIAKQFSFDGWWREGAPSYHWQTVGSLQQVIGVAKGYSDPPEWPEPRFENLDFAEAAPLLQRAVRVGNEGVLPDGRLMLINDTWWSGKRQPLDVSVCRLWSGLGHAILGAGTGVTQFQAHADWGAAYGHTHMDSAALLLFAHGKELLSDIGYTHTRYRNWTINSASHNLVVVDQRSQQLTSDSMGDVRFFDDADPHVQAIDVDARRAYPACTEYRRRLVHVHVDEGRDYVVDWFDVTGGASHDYFLHGSADEEGALDTSLEFDRAVETLVPEWGGTAEHTGEDCCDTSGEKYHAYMFLWNIRTTEAAVPWTATWRYGEVGLRSHLFPEPETAAFRFQSPSVRLARDDDGKLKDYLMNGVMMRHAGGMSRFRAVHAPFTGEPWLGDVRYKDGAFTVVCGDERHTIRWDEERLTVTSTSGWHYDSGVPVSGPVLAVERGGRVAFKVNEGAPAARWVRIDFGGARSMMYPVTAVEGDSFVLPDDPGFAYDAAAQEARFLFHPHDVLPGPLTWTAWRQ